MDDTAAQAESEAYHGVLAGMAVDMAPIIDFMANGPAAAALGPGPQGQEGTPGGGPDGDEQPGG